MTPEVETRLWQRLIEAESSLETLKKRCDTLSTLNDGMGLLLKTLNSRVNGLDSAVIDMAKDIEELYKRVETPDKKVPVIEEPTKFNFADKFFWPWRR